MNKRKKVILDTDLAEIYGIETKKINEAVRNNPTKISEKFSFILNDNKWQSLRSKFSTSSSINNYMKRL